MAQRFKALREFLLYLEKQGELKRIRTQVDPDLEITEIAIRALRLNMPALLFENVKGSRFPLAINILASEKRIELALQANPEALGQQLISFAEQMMPPRLSSILRERKMMRRFFSSRIRYVALATSQEIVVGPNLDQLPILKCWPGDGGRFITLPQVVTYDPRLRYRNIGMYRMHVFDSNTTGMHWQIQKGGGFHYFHSDKIERDLEVAVALGTDPALLLATVSPLPEGIDEALFAGFLRKQATDFVGGRSISINVPANAEFILEGTVSAKERRVEGPFGDHFGHYSASSEFPVFHLKTITHRHSPIYPATVVGIPPMEDKFLGDATQKILGPLSRMLHSEVRGLWAYYEAGFHNLLVVSIEERYQKEAMKTALGLMGTGQLSLTKCMITVSENVDPRDFHAVLMEVHNHFDPHFDFLMLPKVPLDTLDFTSYRMNLGSKMILDATRKRGRKPHHRLVANRHVEHLARRDRRILDIEFVQETLMIIKTGSEGSSLIKKLLNLSELEGIPLLAVVSEDVDIHDKEKYIWGIFTRFDCERDVRFTEQRMIGISPVYGGTLAIDATWKKGYPKPLIMDRKIVRKVDQNWNNYWK